MDRRIPIRGALKVSIPYEITVCGIVQNVVPRESSALLAVNDGSTILPLQARLPAGQPMGQLSTGCTVELFGILLPPRQNLCREEVPTLDVKLCKILGAADPDTFPLVRHGESKDFLNRNPHLRIRTPRYALLARVRSATLSALSRVFDSHSGGPIYQVHLPMLTWTDCEGGAEVFAAPTQKSKPEGSEMTDSYFGSRKFLNVSAVFHAESFTQGLDRIWTLSPCWRPEAQDSSRYLAEFWMLEVSLNYIDSLVPLYQLMEDTIHGIFLELQKSHAGQELLAESGSDELSQRWAKLLTTGWPKITFAEAIELLKTLRNDPSAEETSDLTDEDEKLLSAHFDSPVFLTHFPSKIRLFQAAQSVQSADEILPSTSIDDAQTTEAFDLLLPGIGEICSGDLREHRLDVLVDTMRKKYFFNGQKKGPIPDRNAAPDAQPYPYLHPGEDFKSLEWLADLRRWGTSPHSGFGIGFERLLQYLTGSETVKDVISFPRYRGICGC